MCSILVMLYECVGDECWASAEGMEQSRNSLHHVREGAPFEETVSRRGEEDVHLHPLGAAGCLVVCRWEIRGVRSNIERDMAISQ